MARLVVTAVFDIGKTNKKFFVFDENFNQVEHEYIRFSEIEDDDGFPSEDLDKLTAWVFSTFDKLLANEKYRVKSLNFSTYGASLVHLDKDGNRVAPFYNYLKPFPIELEKQFFSNITRQEFEITTGSPFMGMLNSGLQLYFLKYIKPYIFSKVKYALHLPQYLSSLFTKQYVTDFTSLGCHTGLWDFSKGEYADWVNVEGFPKILAPIVPSTHTTIIERKGQQVAVGAGVHDSSSTLIPYINSSDEPFVLISTGTWSICMNFFNQGLLTPKELKADCLNFLSLKGTSLKASRLHLGRHLSEQAKLLSSIFKVDYAAYKTIEWPIDFLSKRSRKEALLFDHCLIEPERFGFTNEPNPDYSVFDSYQDALLNLFDELTDLQIASLKLVDEESDIKKIYLDGGVSSSKVFIAFLSRKLPGFDIYSSSIALGSAMGAALLVNDKVLPKSFLSNNYKTIKHEVV
ncbi:MAG: FGGY family carbohydrate kinase [Bacteroidota bacterium]